MEHIPPVSADTLIASLSPGSRDLTRFDNLDTRIKQEFFGLDEGHEVLAHLSAAHSQNKALAANFNGDPLAGLPNQDLTTRAGLSFGDQLFMGVMAGIIVTIAAVIALKLFAGV